MRCPSTATNRLLNIFERVFLPKVKDLMVKDVHTVDISASVRDAYLIMAEDYVHAVVITKDGKPVGIISRRDILRKCFFHNLDSEKTSIGEVMSQPLITIGPNENVLKAYELMMEKNIRRLIVLEKGEMIGAIRLDDIKHLSSDNPITAFYRIGYFLLGILATIVVVILVRAT